MERPQRYHMNKNGEPAVCHASKKCPLRTDDGKTVNHYFGTKEEARRAFENSSENIPRSATKKKAPKVPLKKNSPAPKKTVTEKPLEKATVSVAKTHTKDYADADFKHLLEVSSIDAKDSEARSKSLNILSKQLRGGLSFDREKAWSKYSSLPGFTAAITKEEFKQTNPEANKKLFDKVTELEMHNYNAVRVHNSASEILQKMEKPRANGKYFTNLPNKTVWEGSEEYSVRNSLDKGENGELVISAKAVKEYSAPLKQTSQKFIVPKEHIKDYFNGADRMLQLMESTATVTTMKRELPLQEEKNSKLVFESKDNGELTLTIYGEGGDSFTQVKGYQGDNSLILTNHTKSTQGEGEGSMVMGKLEFMKALQNFKTNYSKV